MKCGYSKCSKVRPVETDSSVMDQGIMRGGKWFCSHTHFEEQTRSEWTSKTKVDIKRKCRNTTCQNMRPARFWDKLKKGEGIERDGFWFCSPECYDEDIKRKWSEERERYLSQDIKGRIHKVKFGALLLQEGAITPEQLEGALEHSKKTKKRIGQCLLDLGDISEASLTKILSRQEGIPKIDLDRTTLKPEVINLLNKSQAKKYKALPIEILKRTGTLVLAVSDPSDKLSLIDLKYITGYAIEPYIVHESSLISALKRYYGLTDDDFEPVKRVDIKEEKGAATTAAKSNNVSKGDILELKNAVNVIMSTMKQKGASNFDMRIEGDEIKGRFDYGKIRCSINFKKISGD